MKKSQDQAIKSLRKKVRDLLKKEEQFDAFVAEKEETKGEAGEMAKTIES